jgi:N utilization substance protein B
MMDAAEGRSVRGGSMPVLHRYRDEPGFYAVADRGGETVTYRLSREGAAFLTEVLGLRDGDEIRPRDLDLLIDRDWASVGPGAAEAEAEAGPAPEPGPPPAAEPTPPPARPSREPSPEPRPARSPGSRARGESARQGQARRRRGREVALQVLYWLEQYPEANPADVERFLLRRLGDEKVVEFARGLIEGVRSRQAFLDEQISAVAENWRIDRMAAIDRNILRLGAFEMLQGPDVPRRVAINEALELAKRYSTAQSSRFVNGVLDRLHLDEPGAEGPVADEANP